MSMEAPSPPAGPEGQKYVMTYMRLLRHAVYLEPCSGPTANEVRQAFSRCLFRSGTLPCMLRSDRGPEFRNEILREQAALIGLNHKMGAPWRPMEQGLFLIPI